ncbi:izumo sperm-egg fusion protein 2 [Tiliqua scincoides]|uniref:izumo sperm-egg fusion protein 2 n=1 Tax=Tiliqua scincoides TaxID=71010 RepID=UPI0034625A15
MLLSGPLLWLLLLCLAWLPSGLWSCLQCDKTFKDNLAKLQTEVVEKKIHDTRLKERAKVLLKGLEGSFFRHYATTQFSGFAAKRKVDDLMKVGRQETEGLLQTPLADQALLEELVTFRREMTMKLKEILKQHQMKACDSNDCAWLQYKVFNCIKCRDATVTCLTLSQCFIDSQERVSLRFGHPLQEPKIAGNGVAIVLCMGGVLFVVIIGVIITYWRNRLFIYV